jgi:phospholipase B1
MITIFFGANDVCSAQCYNPKDFSPIRYLLHLRRTLDFLRTTLPRTIINLIPAIGIYMDTFVSMHAWMHANIHARTDTCTRTVFN